MKTPRSMSLILILALTSAVYAKADTDAATATDATTAVQNMTEAELQANLNSEADRLDGVDTEAHANGVELSDETKGDVKAVSSDVREQANTPGLKDRLLSVLRHAGTDGRKGGIILLKGTGYVGRAGFDLTVAPFMLGTDFTTAVISGQGYLSEGVGDKSNGAIYVAGLAGGAGAWIGGMDGLADLTTSAFTGVMLAGMGTFMVTEIACSTKAAEGGSFKTYCNNLTRVDHTVFGDAAKIGEKAGQGTRKAARWVGHEVKSLVRSRREAAPQPAS